MTSGLVSHPSSKSTSSRCCRLQPHARWKFADSPLEGTGFEPAVPREIDSGFEAWPELRRVTLGATVLAEQPRPRQTDRAHAAARGAGSHRRLKRPRCRRWRGFAKLTVRIHSLQRRLGELSTDGSGLRPDPNILRHPRQIATKKSKIGRSGGGGSSRCCPL